MTAPVVETHIREALERVAQQRRIAEDYRASVQARRDAFEAEYADEIGLAKQAQDESDRLERQARELVLAHYAATGEQKPCPGADIALRSEFTIDEPAALAWAKASGTALVPESVDLAAIKKIARATPLSFVTETRVPSVRLATDLDAALAAA